MSKHQHKPFDFVAAHHGSIIVLVPLTQAAIDWVEEHIDIEQTWGKNGVVIEPRYFGAILEGLQADGLTVA